MQEKFICVLAAASVLLLFAGCQDVSTGSETTFTSIQSASSSSVSRSMAAESVMSSNEMSSVSKVNSDKEAHTLKNISFSDGTETVIMYPSEMLDADVIWLDSSRLCMTFKDKTGGGVIADVEDRTFTQISTDRVCWDSIAYGDDCVYLWIHEGYSLQKRDKNFNLLSSRSYAEEFEKYECVCAVDMTSESLYYIQQDDPQKPVLCRIQGEKTEIIKELSPLEDREFYSGLDISPSGEKMFFYKINHEILDKYIYIYDIKSDTLTDYTQVSSEFWTPEGMWMGEQPVFLLDHKNENNKRSDELRYGIPPETKMEIFHGSLGEGRISVGTRHKDSPWSGFIFSVCLGQPYVCRDILYYFKDDGTYLSYTVDKNCYYPQLSPDYKYLAYSSRVQERDDLREITILPTESLWKPLDWGQVQGEMEGMIEEMAKGKQG